MIVLNLRNPAGVYAKTRSSTWKLADIYRDAKYNELVTTLSIALNLNLKKMFFILCFYPIINDLQLLVFMFLCRNVNMKHGAQV